MNKQELITYVSGLRLTDLQPAPVGEPKFVCFRTPGSHAEAAWRLLREHVDQTMHWPVVIGDDENAERVMEQVSLGDVTPAEVIVKAEKLDIDGWIQERVDADEEYYQQGYEEPHQQSAGGGSGGGLFGALMGAITGRGASKAAPAGGARKYTWETVRNVLTRQYLKNVNILMAPTAIPWEVAAYLNYGGWNECPSPEVQVALHKKWFDKWHAEPFAMTADVIEMHVRKPVPAGEEAFELARQQFVYCPDIVYQGVETVSRLAEEIAESDGWYFWWD